MTAWNESLNPTVWTPGQSLEDALEVVRNQEDKAEQEGATVFRICKDVAHWHGYGITTGDQFWDYLEAC